MSKLDKQTRGPGYVGEKFASKGAATRLGVKKGPMAGTGKLPSGQDQVAVKQKRTTMSGGETRKTKERSSTEAAMGELRRRSSSGPFRTESI